jgi:PmbA protein
MQRTNTNIEKWALKACELLKKKPIDQAEVVVFGGSSIGVEIEKNEIFSSEMHSQQGISLIAFVKGGRGKYSTTIYDEKDIDKVVEKVTSISRSAHPDPDFKTLPFPAEYKKVKNLFDEGLVSLDKKQIFEWATNAIKEAIDVEPRIFLSGGVNSTLGESFLANTNGVRAFGKTTNVSISLFGVVRSGTDTGSAFDFDEARMLKDFSPSSLGKKVANEAKKQLGAKRCRSGKLPVVFGPLASLSLLDTLASACNAEDIQRKRSFLCDMKGKKIASEILSITDDPLIQAGLQSSPFDGEGAAHKKILLIDGGVLKTYLHSSYTAGKSGEENTAHATFGGGISHTNLVLQLGNRIAQKIIGDIKEGVYIDNMSVHPDSTSGDFSQPIDFGFKIESGKIAYPLKETMIGGNFLELLQNIEEISSDYRAEPGNIMPTIKVREMQVIG